MATAQTSNAGSLFKIRERSWSPILKQKPFTEVKQNHLHRNGRQGRKGRQDQNLTAEGAERAEDRREELTWFGWIRIARKTRFQKTLQYASN
jgi:hypothetical protein